MTRRNSRLFWSALVLAGSLTVLAAPGAVGDPLPAVCAQGDPSQCSQPVEKGQVVPFSGQLLTPNLAISLGQKASFCDERLTLELKHVKAESTIDLTLEKQLRANDRLTWETEKKLLLERLEEAKAPPPWYTHPAFVITVTIIGTAALAYGMFELATHVQ